MEQPFDFPAVTVRSPQKAYDWVVANVGASNPRDEVDQYLIDELTSLGKKGETISDEADLPTGGPGKISDGIPPKDTDRDGMADKWELANNLDPNNKEDYKEVNAEGYTNLEVYINQLVESGY